MEDASISKLAYLAVEKTYDILEYSRGCFRVYAASLLGGR